MTDSQHPAAYPGWRGEQPLRTSAQPPLGPPDHLPAGGPKPRLLDAPGLIVVVVSIVLALGGVAVLGGELYARHRVNSLVAKVFECEVGDGARVSFGSRPLLLQLMTGEYSNISIETAGNQIREAKGMKVNVQIDNLKLNSTADSRGTLGSLGADITWSNDGIKQSLQDAIPLFGAMITGVSTNPTDATIQLQGGGFGSITARPQVADGGLALQVISLTGMGFPLPRETVQPALDAFNSSLTKNLPMGIHADSVQVTNSGLTSRFSTRDVTIPLGGHDPCLTGM